MKKFVLEVVFVGIKLYVKLIRLEFIFVYFFTKSSKYPLTKHRVIFKTKELY